MKRRKRTLWPAAVACVVLLSMTTPLPAAGVGDVCLAIGIKEKDAMFCSVLSARVLQGGGKQVVSVTTYFTGRKDLDNAVNVRLDVFSESDGKLVPVFSRDYGKEYEGLSLIHI